MEIIDSLIEKIESIVNEGKELIDKARERAREAKEYPNKLDSAFYLQVQDDLSEYYDLLLEKYLTVDAFYRDCEAIVTLAVKTKYEGEKKKPNADQLKAEIRNELTKISMASNILDGWQKSVRNYIAGARAHINALTGKEYKSE